MESAFALCKVPDCTRAVHARGYCRVHYDRWHTLFSGIRTRRYTSKHTTACSLPGCGRPYYALDLCERCYNRKRLKKPRTWTKGGRGQYRSPLTTTQTGTGEN